jgi:hypothetical protein
MQVETLAKTLAKTLVRESMDEARINSAPSPFNAAG